MNEPMNVNILAGYEATPLNGLVYFKSEKKFRHIANFIPWSGPRLAFRGMINLNVFGLATALNFAWSRSATEKKHWQNGWYNLGGNFDNLQKSVTKGHAKKPLLIRRAPIFIQRAYQNATGKKISGVGLSGEPVTTMTMIATGTAAVLALTELIKTAYAVAGKSLNTNPAPDIPDVPDPGNGDDDPKFGFKIDTKKVLILSGIVLTVLNWDSITKSFKSKQK